MNDHFIGFHQLVQKLEWITPIISTLQDKQNEWSLYGVSSIALKVKMNNTHSLFENGELCRVKVISLLSGAHPTKMTALR